MERWIRLCGPAVWALFTVLSLSPVHAGVDFAALPDRTNATLTLAGNGALVEEERMLGLEEGVNEIRFSWQGLPVFEDSIRLNIHDDENISRVLAIAHPPGEAALVWRVYSSRPALVRARISYVLFRIDGLFPMRIVADEDETSCRFERHLVLRNFSGEDFEDISVITPGGTVRNRQVRDGETLRTLLTADDGIRIEKIWRYDSRGTLQRSRPVDAGIPVYYRITNSAEAGLGRAPIPGGKVRVFHRDGTGETLLLGEDRIETIHPGARRDVYLGESREISVQATVMKEEPVNVRRNRDHRIVLYDTDETVRFVIENFKGAPLILNLTHHIPGQWEMAESSLPWKRTGAHMVEVDVHLEPRSVKELALHYNRRNVRP